MSHQELQKVSGHTRLYRRGNRYYLRAKVPVDLQTSLKRKEVKHALKTSDYREALRIVKFESIKVDAIFDEARQKLHERAKHVEKLSEAQALQLITRWFLNIEQKSEDWYDSQFERLSDHDKQDILENLRLDESIYSGANKAYSGNGGDGKIELQSILCKNGVSIEAGTPLFERMSALVRKARVENTRRNMERLIGDVPREHDERVWQHITQVTEHAPKTTAITLGEMLERHRNELIKGKRSEATIRAYQMPVRILEEIIGKDTSLDSITRDHMEKIRDVLKEIPVNSKQRYSGKTLLEAIGEANTLQNVRRLDDRTAMNYFNSIVAIFNYAVKVCKMPLNPASDSWLKSAFKPKKKTKAVFGISELNKLFKAPLYTGCLDDENGFAKRGAYIGRRGRFWVPLLGLFHGMRLNEACQLYTEDIREIEGVHCILIRDQVDDGLQTEKGLKTKSSERTIPIHHELLKMGFIEYVKRRRLDKKRPRLFYELTRGKTGKFSDPFQKWFGRFLITTLGTKPKATFHSFRHMFRDALRRADVSIEKAEALGGWKIERSSESQYGAGFAIPTLRDELWKISYDGLSLSHLYKKKQRIVDAKH